MKCREAIAMFHNRTTNKKVEVRCGDYFLNTTQLCTKCLKDARLRKRLLAIRHTEAVLKAM